MPKAPWVTALMDRISYTRHPDWVDAMLTDPTARPSRIEIDARALRAADTRLGSVGIRLRERATHKQNQCGQNPHRNPDENTPLP